MWAANIYKAALTFSLVCGPSNFVCNIFAAGIKHAKVANKINNADLVRLEDVQQVFKRGKENLVRSFSGKR
jgi:hypothetical protein